MLVPLPHAIDNDQLRNAEAFARIRRRMGHPQASSGRTSSPPSSPACASPTASLRRGFGCPRRSAQPDAALRLADAIERMILEAETQQSTQRQCRRRKESAMKLPRDVGPIHFIGIGGIGMSGIAEVMKTLGYEVQGSDIADNYNVARLRKSGVAVVIGHDPKTSAIGPGRGRLLGGEGATIPKSSRRARRFLPIVRRAEMLAELMRFKSCVAIGGTHGKTTTTSMVAALLDAGGLDPTVINGGIINAYGTNARLGKGDWMVVESDESDGTFVKLPADIVIVTNIDPEHLDHYGSFEAARPPTWPSSRTSRSTALPSCASIIRRCRR